MGNLKQQSLGYWRIEERKADDKTRKWKIESHEKQRLATLKRLKLGDNNELKRNLRLEKVVAGKQLRLAMETEEQDWRMMQLFWKVGNYAYHSNLMF